MKQNQNLLYAVLLSSPVLALLAWALQQLSGLAMPVDLLLAVSAMPAMLLLLRDVWRAIRQRDMGVDLLALLSIAGSLALQQPLTAAIIAAMTASGRWLDRYAAGRAEREMSGLLARAPRHANRLGEDGMQRVALDEVRVGDRLLVKAGETVPVDGRLLDAAALLDESTLSGEAKPVDHQAGALLRSGTLNAGAAFSMTATTTAAQSTFSGIIKLVAEASGARAPLTRMADRYALWFIPLALGLAGLAWLLSQDPLRALAVLVVATPCPLVLAVPVAILSGISRCASRGVLVKGGAVLEALDRATLLFFDKTGTLTGGKARLVAIHPAATIAPAEVLRLAAALDQMSCNVIATAVLQAALEQGETKLPLPQQLEETPGAGLCGVLDGRRLALGSHAFVAGQINTMPDWASALQGRLDIEGASAVFVARDGVLLGVLEMSDQLRLETPRALRMLRRSGIRQISMLSGDRQDVAEAIGHGIGVDRIYAGLQPQDKLRHLQEAARHGVTIMVGDGVNDAPALSAAGVGVAMGGQGAAAAAESAGVVLLNDRLDRLAEVVMTAHRTMAIARQSVMAGMGLSLLAMLAAACGYLPPVAGAVLQEVIDLAVILNALRALTPHPALLQVRPLSADAAQQLKAEHARLHPLLQQLAALARGLPQLQYAQQLEELVRLDAMLTQQLLPHETMEEQHVYPAMAQLLGGEDPLAALSRSHQEIFKLSRKLAMQIAALPQPASQLEILELQRTLYSLDTVLQLHFAQEDELYQSMS